MIRRAVTMASLSLALATGCKSAFVDMHVQNRTGGPVALLEVDYPGGSFGKETVAAGADFDYRLKIFNGGNGAVSWTDGRHAQHSYKGPDLREGEHGSITLTLEPSAAKWDLHLQR